MSWLPEEDSERADATPEPSPRSAEDAGTRPDDDGGLLTIARRWRKDPARRAGRGVAVVEVRRASAGPPRTIEHNTPITAAVLPGRAWAPSRPTTHRRATRPTARDEPRSSAAAILASRPGRARAAACAGRNRGARPRRRHTGPPPPRIIEISASWSWHAALRSGYDLDSLVHGAPARSGWVRAAARAAGACRCRTAGWSQRPSRCIRFSGRPGPIRQRLRRAGRSWIRRRILLPRS